MKTFPFYFIFLWVLVVLAGCQASTATTGTANQQNLEPAQVDVKGYINSREYSQGQVVIFVEGQTGPGTRFSQAQVVVNPATQITDTNGKRLNMSALYIGQRVSVVFMGQFKPGGVGRTAQANARQIWVEVPDTQE